uniref:Uncharacterized protein n=1 Tax=Anguilla anguilla TaxID=7936 RepID=A0A0E9SR05_ANGAN
MECFWWGEIFGTVIPMHGCTVLAFLSLGCLGAVVRNDGTFPLSTCKKMF